MVSEDVGNRINAQMLLATCKKNDLYTTPKLNDRLYLHFHGIRDIEGLEEYENLNGALSAATARSTWTCRLLLFALAVFAST